MTDDVSASSALISTQRTYSGLTSAAFAQLHTSVTMGLWTPTTDNFAIVADPAFAFRAFFAA